MLQTILPISRRVAGIRIDSEISSNLTRYQLEDIRVPTLVISAADDLYGTYDSGLYTAEQIQNGRFAGFGTGGHLLLGHEQEVRSQITNFLEERLKSPKKTAMAV
jgi:2-hydroxy-6-oxonona-2,4-dienedioate hydrolase